MARENSINIPGELHSVATGNIVAGTDEIFDYDSSMYQNQINKCVGYYVDNPEFVQATIDNENKLIYCVDKSGTFKLSSFDINGFKYSIINNSEWLRCIIDSDNKVVFGIKYDGKTYADFAGIDEKLQKTIDEINAEVDDKIKKFDEIFEIVDNPEYIYVELDSSNHILGGRYEDGTSFENVGFRTKKLNIENNEISELDDPEKRIEMTLDSDNKILSYRDKDGIIYENYINIKEALYLSDKAIKELKEQLDFNFDGHNNYVSPNIPKYGSTNIKTEDFYLTFDQRINNIDDVVCIQDFEDSDSNAWDRMSISHYYIKSTLIDNGDGTYSKNENSVRLTHYAYGKVSYNSDDGKYYAKDPIRKINGVCYYADSLGYNDSTRNKVIDGYSRIAPYDQQLQEGGTKQTLVEVVPITGPVVLGSWTVEDWEWNNVAGTDIGKKYEHRCVCDIDFGYYFSQNDMYIGVKHQGNSTQGYRKRNYRYTLYKNNAYSKKNKVKIGEMLRLSGYNLKAYWKDLSRIKELILYRLVLQIWNNRPITDRYPWDKDNGFYSGATGIIQGFPIKVYMNNDFYGIYCFTLKKDEKNYMLDGTDESGMFIIGAAGSSNDWGITLPYNVPTFWDDEMMDEMSQSTIDAVSIWIDFINDRLVDDNGNIIPFNKENVEMRFDVLGFIDYFIFIECFILCDNMFNNLIFYSGPDKTKMYPYFYDMDLSFSYWSSSPETPEVLNLNQKDSMLWNKFKDLYWDEIINRYSELRKNYLTKENIETIYNDIKDNIPEQDYISEKNRWQVSVSPSAFDINLKFIKDRLDYLDKNYFKN